MRNISNSYRNRLIFDEVDISGFEDMPRPASGHVHDAIEISAFKNDTVTMLYGGKPVSIKPNCLIIHWGMLPHQVIEQPANAIVVGLHIPLAWIMQWNLPASLLTRLLNLEIFIEQPQSQPYSDLDILHNWNTLLKNGDDISMDIIVTEVRARLLRLSQIHDHKPAPVHTDIHTPLLFSTALKYIVRHFRDPIQLTDIAQAAKISSRHLTRLFHQNTGQTINTYITRLRLSYAMRLLVTTDRTVTDIMYDSGFSCTTHFYKVFREQTGSTPRQYRKPKV